MKQFIIFPIRNKCVGDPFGCVMGFFAIIMLTLLTFAFLLLIIQWAKAILG